ncbi:MAG: tRNA (adenosine(37)-N6)-threonylcarbamoyltransferase complex ATPase subunit type 1 TsaE [Candidatus Colwellbacteria bacterium RIFCSPHIGHO2_02_FULL_45_17]|uniref:tRNA threonylcarbamoyladenosine biosynthesis protein TsaE n=1 Tax=Candidatus Colwellbacteria bacterium RIFCSPLOWO2_02_FULL_45_11 TaxID=1797692 RepID=A0A1G1ZB98_9BACT|nr:MAG: tRNA (adenosine(37)-N6)-threonylcarbamoyltransferase complex ATPase subunit type 1 TsaE [Candidatus Colwellbacteria bacterium RIFCSPHIGHO2_02_FULL_45_17]OGY60907.1 MAG: tRNA (adenosine(37)-N6)-threonylcarbamoyltransferase complex ATPase subunit type 1 TsaE [Candidatus Colwellbacteria bacterium RIFCSPLOWO2_02_FULL_45_11]
MKRYITKSPAKTRALARNIAENPKRPRPTQGATVLGLIGDLGAGKTTFIKSFIRSMGVKKRITSPTFLILRRFAINNKIFKNIFHVDAYRIKDEKDLRGINIRDVLKEPSNIVLVEWADRIKKVLPKETIWVKFKYGKERDEREITID